MNEQSGNKKYNTISRVQQSASDNDSENCWNTWEGVSLPEPYPGTSL